jgi:restriction endonuclease S subunit
MNTENKNSLLRDLASIRSGIYRKSIPKGEKGKIYQIQKGNFDENGNLLPLPKNPELAMESSLSKHFLHGNEILITAKGEANTAYLFPEIAQDAVASSVFLILTVKSKELSVPYLTWYLNTRQCQFSLNQLSRGSGVHSLAKRDLQQISVPLPPLRVQRAILQLIELQRSERELYQQLITEKQQLAEAQLLHLTTGAVLPQPPQGAAQLNSNA